ncbi:MAG: AAA family ATPase [Anaerolinea sp.]|nr:AAA family ATPase [Anaerolinea sp.]
MWLLARQGQRSAALAQYEACREILARELNLEPAVETAVLYERIRAGDIDRPAPQHPTPQPLPRPRPFGSQTTPFVAGPPITRPAQFFGRERELKRLFNLLKRLPLQNAALVGPRRSGKTSLLHYLRTITTTPPGQLRPAQRADWLPVPQQYRWVFVDFQDPRLGGRRALLHHLLTQMELPTPDACDLDQFLDIVSDNLQRPTVVLLDEIGVALARYPELDDAFWESLRSLATNQVGGALAFVLAASEAPELLAHHQGMGSPFFNIFGYTAHLGPLTDDEAQELIASSPIPFTAADVVWILAQSGRWPMPLQILCRERLLTLEEGDLGDAWREDAQQQIAPFLELKTPTAM